MRGNTRGLLAAWALCVGCTPVPPEVTSESTPATSEPMTSSTGAETDDPVTTEPTASVGDTTLSDPTSTTNSDPDSSSGGTEGSTTTSSSGETDTDTTGTVESCHPLLAEALVRVNSSDDGYEWIRLYNPCPDAIDLVGYSLGWGGRDYTYGDADLMGTIESMDCLLIGGPTSAGNNGNPTYDVMLNFNPDFQDGGSPADGIALFDALSSVVDGSTVPIDALVYGGPNDSDLLGPDDTPSPTHVGAPPNNESMRRTSLDPTWEIEPSPTPNDCPIL